MNIAITADLHLGITRLPIITSFAQEQIVPQNPDAIVLAGDIGESLLDHNASIHRDHAFRICIRAFRQAMPHVPVLVVAGNHDIWVGDPRDDDEPDSRELWYRELQKRTEQEGAVWLESANWVKDGVAIVGSMLHYDFSAQDKVGPVAGYRTDYFIVNKKNIINDGRYFHGLPPDLEFAQEIGEGFRKRLLAAQNDAQINEIIIVTHVPCLEQQITRRPQNQSWAMATPYFGNLSHQDLIVRCGKVSHVVSGHSHVAQEGTIGRGNMQELQAIVVGSDYHQPVVRFIRTAVR